MKKSVVLNTFKYEHSTQIMTTDGLKLITGTLTVQCNNLGKRSLLTDHILIVLPWLSK